MDDTKTRTSGGKAVSRRLNCPTQAKTGLEWATRDRMTFRAMAYSEGSHVVVKPSDTARGVARSVANSNLNRANGGPRTLVLQ